MSERKPEGKQKDPATEVERLKRDLEALRRERAASPSSASQAQP